MQLEVKIPKEINEYQEKIIFGMSIRQLICVSIAIVLCTATYFLAEPFIGGDLAGYLVLAESMPIMGVGFVNVNGFSFEKYVMIVIRYYSSNRIRRYKTELLTNVVDDYDDFETDGFGDDELAAKAKKERYSRVKGEARNTKVLKK
jgi:hypothetical protein